MTGPLQDVTVVTLEQAVAAPFASRHLADLGARVIKIERDTGDFARAYDQSVRGLSSYFVWLNRGKESVVLDLKRRDDMDVLRSIIADADVFIQNLAPGAAARLGLSSDELLETNPRLVYVSISGYGPGGSYEDKKAYDLLVQCESGLLSVTGTADAPVKVGISIADISAGMYAYSTVLAALFNRTRTGRGDVIEISMLETMGEWVTQPMYYAVYSGSPPARTGAHHASIAPYGPFMVSDGIVFLAVQNEREWQRFCDQVLADPSVAADPRFASTAQRVSNRDALHSAIDAVLQPLSATEAIERLDAAQIANARLRTMDEFAAHPQLRDRGRWRKVGTPAGEIDALLPPFTARDLSVTMGDVPSLGDHSDAIRTEFGRQNLRRRLHHRE